jgi:hypothetical protein
MCLQQHSYGTSARRQQRMPSLRQLRRSKWARTERSRSDRPPGRPPRPHLCSGDVTPRSGDVTPRSGDVTPRSADLLPVLDKVVPLRPGDLPALPEVRPRGRRSSPLAPATSPLAPCAFLPCGDDGWQRGAESGSGRVGPLEVQAAGCGAETLPFGGRPAAVEQVLGRFSLADGWIRAKGCLARLAGGKPSPWDRRRHPRHAPAVAMRLCARRIGVEDEDESSRGRSADVLRPKRVRRGSRRSRRSRGRRALHHARSGGTRRRRRRGNSLTTG